jgi:hypothetical protein
MMGRIHKNPRAPDNMYSSAEFVPSPPDIVATPEIHDKAP